MESDDPRDLLAVQRTLQGDTGAFGEIVDRYTPMLYSLSYRLLGNREEAEDAVQEIFERAYRSIGRFRLGSRFYTWLYTIGVNWLRSALRKRRRRGYDVALPDELRDRRNGPCEGRDLAALLAEREAHEAALRAIGSLTAMYRIVFVMHYFELMPLQHIADVLRVPVGTVKTRLRRARTALATALTEDE